MHCQDLWLRSPVVLTDALLGMAVIMGVWLGGVWLREAMHGFPRAAGLAAMGFALLAYLAIASYFLEYGVTSGMSSSWPELPCYAEPYSRWSVGMAITLGIVAMLVSARRWRSATTDSNVAKTPQHQGPEDDGDAGR